MQSTFRQRLLASTIILGAASLAAPAWAQDVEAEEPGASVTGASSVADQAEIATQQATTGEAIIVTGSRIARPQLEGASPVTVVNSQEVKLQGITRTEDLLNSLPQVFAGQGGNIANGASGTATLNLRGLGSQRTLVLVNGRRLLPGDTGSSAADINIIPAAMIDRIDVLTGGASSVYGSDAISGVVNFVLDTDFEGIRLDTQYSFYQHNNDAGARVIDALDARGFPYPTGSVADGGTFEVTGVIGAGFDDGRGHVTAYAGYRKINQALQRDRDYGACSLAAFADSDGFSCSGSGTSARGTFLTNVGNFTVGPNRTFIPSNSTTNPPFNFGPYNHFQRPDERYVLGAFANYEISSAVQPYLEVMFMDDRTEAQIAPSGIFFNTGFINCDNPFLSAQQRGIICAPAVYDPADAAAIADNPATPVNEAAYRSFFGNLVGNTPIFGDDPDGPNGPLRAPLLGFEAPTAFPGTAGLPDFNRAVFYPGRRNVEGGGRVSDIQHSDFRIVGGVRGDLSPAWSYDAYYQFGRVTNPSISRNDFSVQRIGRALDVVADPDTGAPVCRSVLQGIEDGCVPYDFFAFGSVDAAALGYLQTPAITIGRTEESVFNASITGDLGQMGLRFPWANDGIGINVGTEYRKESLDFLPDRASQEGDLAGSGGASTPISGSFDVKEVFGEVRVPIIQDGFIEELVLEAGYRYSDYSTGVTTDTYKIQGELAPTRDIRIRGGYNRAVRAPNVVELFSPQNVVLVGTNDPCDGLIGGDPEDDPTLTAAQCAFTGLDPALYGRVPENPASQYNGLVGGNPNLDPEVADTYTAGVVLTPTFLPGFAATVDYFDISLDGAISTLNADVVVQRCGETGDAFLCSLINRDSRGSLWIAPDGFVVATNQNIGSLSTSGVDVSVSYNTEIGSLGSLSASMVGTWLDELITDDGINEPYDCTGLYGNVCLTPNPEWRHKARLTWTTPDDIGLSVQWRHFGSVKQDTTSSQPALEGTSQPAHDKLRAMNYIDLAATFRVMDNYNFRLGVNNVFDSNPPLAGSQACPAVICANTYAQVYDVLGRYIYAGVTLDF